MNRRLDEEADDTQLVLIPRGLFKEIEDGSEIEIDVLNDDRITVVSVPFIANFHYSNCFEDENGQIVFDTVQTVQRDVSRLPEQDIQTDERLVVSSLIVSPVVKLSIQTRSTGYTK